MIDIIHMHDDDGAYCVVETDDDAIGALNYFEWFDLIDYHSGRIRPHYPVPAIPIEIDYFDWCIAVCEMNNPAYKYGSITLYPHD